jgi:integrase
MKSKGPMKRSPPGKPRTELPGLHKVFKSISGGRWRLHVYAYRGGPSIGVFEGNSRTDVLRQLETPSNALALASSYSALARSAPVATTLADILHQYEASEKFRRKSESTKYRERGPLEEIRKSKLGSMPVKALASKKVRRILEEWRFEVGEKQGLRAADVRMGLISKALAWALEGGLVPANPAYGIDHLYDVDRSEIIFLPQDLETFEAAARARRRKNLKKGAKEPEKPPHTVLALLLVCFTGLRREDICNLSWSQIEDDTIRLKPLKSLRRARTAKKLKEAPTATIPITPELRLILAQCDPGPEKRSPWVLTSSRGRKYTPSGLTSSFIKVRDVANIVDDDGEKKHFHDARGTFVTNMRAKGFSDDDVAEMVGWSKQDVQKVAKRYVHRGIVSLATIERVLKNASGTLM